jgi:hypothetical protein
MSNKKGVSGYPAADLVAGDVIDILGKEYTVFWIVGVSICLHQSGDITKTTTIDSNCTVRLIRKARGITYAAWQRRTSKILKEMGLSKWPGAVMHEYFFNSVSPEEAAAGFLADHFLINEQ